GCRLQEDQDGHAGERGLGRGRAAPAGDADHQRVAHPRSRAPRPDLAAAGRVVTRETMRAQLMQGETFTPTIYLYDNQPGGIGLAERIFEVLPDLLARGFETLEACGC